MRKGFKNILFIFLFAIMGAASATDKTKDWLNHVPSVEEADLLPEVISFLNKSFPQHMDKMLAVRLGGFKGDSYSKNLLGDYQRYKLTIHVAFKSDDKSGHAFVIQGQCFTQEAKQGPPFKSCFVAESLDHKYVDEQKLFHWYVPLDQLPDQSKYGINGSAGGSVIMALLLSVALLVCGLLLAAPVVRQKVPALNVVYGSIEPVRAIIGLAALVIGILALLGNLLSPLQDIVPIALALVAGLLLGMELLLRKPEKSMAESVTDIDSEGETASKVHEKIGDSAVKAAAATDAAIGKVQDVLRENKEKIGKLEAFNVPIGYACLVAGVLHLIMGNAIFL